VGKTLTSVLKLGLSSSPRTSLNSNRELPSIMTQSNTLGLCGRFGGAVMFMLLMSAQLNAQSATGHATSDHPTEPSSWQSAAGGRMGFEVASVRPSENGSSPGGNMSMNTGDYFSPTGGLFASNFPLITYIEFAYKLSLDSHREKSILDSLPKWAATQMFSVHARATGNPTSRINTA
jgi:hypothetical protein